MDTFSFIIKSLKTSAAIHRLSGEFWPTWNLKVKLTEEVKEPLQTLLFIWNHQLEVLMTLIRVVLRSLNPEPERSGGVVVLMLSGLSCILSLLSDFKAISSTCSPLKSPQT